MGSTASVVLLGVAIVCAVAAAGVWIAIRRPALHRQRRQRASALAAAERYTPAPRKAVYGSVKPAPDPCDPGLTDGERVAAMRALLLRGDAQAAQAVMDVDWPSTTNDHHDDPMTTTPMAWNPTLPPDEAEEWDVKRPPSRPRVREGYHDHIAVP